MPTSAVSLREPRLESDALAALRRLQHVRPLSVISDASPLRWRYGERLDEVLEDACRRYADLTAVAADNTDVSFRELSARANQMARFFLRKGVKPGDRVAILLDRGIEAYVALFALLKVRAAYVPLDANHPPERVRFILSDAAASLVVTHLRLADRFADCETPTLVVDGMRAEIAALDGAPLSDDERAPAPNSLCYVLYTSGTTGHPKGVAVAHASICNFVRVAAEHYGFGPGDRVYQGMSVAFDFSIEEIWVPLAAGATLVPNTAAMSLFGEELADLLEERDVTCLCCVPTLLASIDRDLPKLRILLIGGEPCPPTLVKRWSRPARVLLNSYGPTETTVTATLGIMTPDKPVTIGRPLPTYSIAILDPKRDIALELGEAGEIGIAEIGVAEGYLDRPELTAAKFVDDFLALPNNPSGRIYRTGDLGRVNANGEIEYLGRIDTQIKLRGYRIELTEIESVLLETPEIAQVAVTTFEPEPGAPELIAYYSIKHGSPAPDRGAMLAHLRSRLPSYMTPSYLEPLPFIPTLVSNKADRERLPAPKTARLRLSETAAAPSTPTERMLCRALSETLGIEQVSIDGDFFTDYGAHSLLMARFCARVRQIEPSAHVAMRDVYANATIRRLARAMDAVPAAATEERDTSPVHRPSNLAYYGCGGLQMTFYVMVAALAFGAALASLEWAYAAVDRPLELYARALVVAVAWFIGHNGLAIGAKWLLLGRARAETIPLWSLAYFRFWAVRLLVRSAPANAFAGHAAVQCVLAPARREHRPQCGHRFAHRAGRRGFVRSRGRRRHRQERGAAGLRSARQSPVLRRNPDWQERLCRRGGRARHSHERRRFRTTRACLVFGQRPARARRQALSRVAGGGNDHQFPPCGRGLARAAERLAFRGGATPVRARRRGRARRGARRLVDRLLVESRECPRARPLGRRRDARPDRDRDSARALFGRAWGRNSLRSSPCRASPTRSSSRDASIRSTASTTRCSSWWNRSAIRRFSTCCSATAC